MFSLRNKPEKKKINKKKRKESPFQTFSIFGSTSPKKHAALSQTKKSDPISSEPKPGLLNKKLLNSIRSFNLKVFILMKQKEMNNIIATNATKNFRTSEEMILK